MWVTSGCVSSRYKSPRAITVAINLASLIQFVLRRKSSSLFEQIEQNFDQHLSWSFWSPKLPRLAYALTPVVPNKLELQYSEATGSVKGHIRTENDTRKSNLNTKSGKKITREIILSDGAAAMKL